MTNKVRNLVVVLGDQLNLDSAAFDHFDKSRDLVWMAEVRAESTNVWSHKARIAVFLSAMRHFRKELEKKKFPFIYRQLNDMANSGSLAGELDLAIHEHEPVKLIVVQPGEWRVLDDIQRVCSNAGIPLQVLADRHFYTTLDEFNQHAAGRKQLRMEFFYREVRRRTGILMQDGKPVGGKWNYDAENRGAFSKAGPQDIPQPHPFKPDAITRAVLKLVEETFPDHPGELSDFDWPVTPRQAKKALHDFVGNRLADFGDYQDAMWTEQPFLYHSRLSAAMNLKILDPRDVVHAAIEAFENGEAPLAAVEGFVRQIIGWREYVRGVYWAYMPGYLERNSMSASQDLPEFYWSGKTEMTCLSDAIGQTLKYGYAHHIQRLMVTGLYALLLGVDPKQVHQWYLAVYVDAVEWVELPNTLGMSQYADGGVMASKPYVATGKYIKRMSNYCRNCPFDPAKATGDDACPFTTLYWDYLQRHKKVLSQNTRMALQVKNLDRKKPAELAEIRKRAEELRGSYAAKPD
ncbi:MAG: cryptochrome/photolyase family protein [Planctomycetota bacterium]